MRRGAEDWGGRGNLAKLSWKKTGNKRDDKMSFFLQSPPPRRHPGKVAVAVANTRRADRTTLPVLSLRIMLKILGFPFYR